MRSLLARFQKAGLSGLFVFCGLMIAISSAPEAAVAQPLLLKIEKAEAGFDQRTGEPIVEYKLSKDSGKAFGEFTSKNVGRPMELRVNGQVVSRPVIREPILGGGGQISGSFTVDDAKALAARLSSATAKVEVEVVQP